MNRFQRLMALLLAAILLSTVAFATAPTATPPLDILGPLQNSNPTSIPLPFLEVGGSPASLALPHRIACTLAPSSGIAEPYNCPVAWDLDSLSSATPGYKALLGILLPEPGYRLAEGVSNQIFYSVMVTAPGMEAQAITGIAPEYEDRYVLSVGGSPDTLPLWDMGAICLTDHFGEYFICPVQWAWESVNTAVPGSYTVWGQPVLPDGFSLPVGLSGLPGLAQTVGVVAPDCVDLSATWIDPDNNNFLHCQWLYQPADSAPLVLQYATVKDDWHNDSNSWDAPSGHDYGVLQWDCLGLNINLEQLAPQTDYWFRVLYEGNRYSNTLHIYLEDKNFTVEVGGTGGDRDGGDQPGNRLPSLEQPAPKGDSDALNSVMELVTETSTTLSGARLAQLTAQGATVLFEKQGVAAELPSSLLDGLGLGAEQLLEVTLLRPSSDTFSLSIQADGIALEALPETTVRLPWQADGSPLECVDASGTRRSDGIYEPASGTLRCTITAPGAYRIVAAPSGGAPLEISPTPAPPQLPPHTKDAALTPPLERQTATVPAAAKADMPMEPAPPGMAGAVPLMVLFFAMVWLVLRRLRHG